MFEEVAAAVSYTFTQFGIKHSLATNISEGSNATYIMFIVFHLPLDKLPRNFIHYQFEQLTTNKPWHPDLWEKYRWAATLYFWIGWYFQTYD